MADIITLTNDYYNVYNHMVLCNDEDEIKNELNAITNAIYEMLYENLERFITHYASILDEVNASNNKLIMYCASLSLFNPDYMKLLLLKSTQETKYLYVLHIAFALYESHKDLMDDLDDAVEINRSNENIIEIIEHIYRQ